MKAPIIIQDLNDAAAEMSHVKLVLIEGNVASVIGSGGDVYAQFTVEELEILGSPNVYVMLLAIERAQEQKLRR